MILLFVLSTLCAQPIAPEQPTTYLGKSLDQWIGVLRDRENRDRELAISALAAFGPAAKDAVPDLIAILKDPKLSEPDAVLEALGKIGPDAAPAVPFLIAFLIEEIRQGAQPGESTLYELSSALAGVGAPAVPALTKLLGDPDRQIRFHAARTLGEIGPEAKAAVPSLIRELDWELEHFGPDHDSRRHTFVWALGQIGPEAHAAIPSFKILFKREPTNALVEAWGRIDAPPLAELLDRLSNQDPDFSPVYALNKFGRRAQAAVPTLRKLLSDPRIKVRTDAAEALTYIEPPALEALPTLIEAVGLDAEGIQPEWVDIALARVGPPAKAALPALIRRLTQGGGGTGGITALVQIDPQGQESLPALISALKDKNDFTVTAAADGLGLLGPRAEGAIPELTLTLTRATGGFLGDDDPKAAAARALGRIGPAARTAIPTLIAALDSRHISDDKEEEQDPLVVCAAAAAAARVLGTFGPEAKRAVPALTKALVTREKGDMNGPVRSAAALALGRIGPEAKSAVPFLRKVMGEGDPELEAAAAVALSQLAPDGKPLAEAWAAASNDPEGRAIVLGALGKASIEGDVRTRYWLDSLEDTLESAEDEQVYDVFVFVEASFAHLEQLGVGARLAIPRLTELQSHPNPWIRQSARETLAKIVPAGNGTPRAKP